MCCALHCEVFTKKSSNSRRLAYVRNVLRNVTLTHVYCHGYFFFR